MSSVMINGQQRNITSAPDTPLLWVLRCELKLTGTKFGCGIGVCGACTVLVDGAARQACQCPVKTLANSNVTTIEGLNSREAEALRAAWIERDVVQCGYCQSGQLVAATALLMCTQNPGEDEIKSALSNILCRCGTYPRILIAIKDAVRSLQKSASR